MTLPRGQQRRHRESEARAWSDEELEALEQTHVDGMSVQQIVEAFPWDTAPRYLIRDRDQIYGAYFDRRVTRLGIEQVLTAPRSPWQSPYVERVIGSIRRECLDHVIVLDEGHLRRILRGYLDYYHSCRTHLSLQKDAPDSRTIDPPARGNVMAMPKVGGLHHHYIRRAA